MFQGLRTVIYRVPDLARAKAWYTAAFGITPYFDEPFYVGFDIGGYELGLLPDAGSTVGNNVLCWMSRSYPGPIAGTPLTSQSRTSAKASRSPRSPTRSAT